MRKIPDMKISPLDDQMIIYSIVSWHKKTFPNISPLDQVKKLEEEKKEFFASKYSIKEYVDVLIVAIVLKYRFDIETGLAFAGQYWNNFNKDNIIRELKHKFWVNTHRKWNTTTNRHEDEDDNTTRA